MSIDDRRTHDDDDVPPRDDELRALYRQLPVEEPGAEIDDAIRAAARRAVGAAPVRTPVQSFPRVLRWAVPFATAASLILVVMLARDEHPERAAVPEALQEMASVEQGGGVSAPPAITVPDAIVVTDADAMTERNPVAKPEPVASAPAVAMEDAPAPAEPISAPIAPGAPAAVPRQVEEKLSDHVADFSAQQSSPAALAKEEDSGAQLVRRKSTVRQLALESSAAMGAVADVASGPAAGSAAAAPAPVPQAVAPVDWPWSTPPGERIDQGWLAGYHLLSRTGSARDASAVFVVRGAANGDEGSDPAGWRDAIAGSLLHAHGWVQAGACGGEAGLRLLRGGAQVTLQAGSGAVVVAWQREAGCRQ